MAGERTKTSLTLGASVLTGLALLTLAVPLLFAARTHLEQGPTILAPQDRKDRPDFYVVTANFTPELVQLGTTQPFNGHGLPGLLLRIAGVSNPGDMASWTLNGWANETLPASIPTCQSQSIFFDHYDWAFQANDLSGGQGYFLSKQSFIPERLRFDGDQCLPRAGAAGPWELTICVEGVGPDDTDGPGEPRHLYDRDGYRHSDPWDRCEPKTVVVPQPIPFLPVWA